MITSGQPEVHDGEGVQTWRHGRKEKGPLELVFNHNWTRHSLRSLKDMRLTTYIEE